MALTLSTPEQFKNVNLKIIWKLLIIRKQSQKRYRWILLGLYILKNWKLVIKETSALCLLCKKLEEPNCALTDEWIKNRQYIHTMEYYASLKIKKILTYVQYVLILQFWKHYARWNKAAIERQICIVWFFYLFIWS